MNLKNIINYLIYNPLFVRKYDGEICDSKKILILETLCIDDSSPSTFKDYKAKEIYSLHHKDVQPILRPYTDMCRLVVHKNESIIPILYCAKMVDKRLKWRLANDDRVIGDDRYHFIFDPFWDDTTHPFRYVEPYEEDARDFERNLDIDNYSNLMDYLFEIRLDYMNLIANGEAINMYDVDPNLYSNF